MNRTNNTITYRTAAAVLAAMAFAACGDSGSVVPVTPEMAAAAEAAGGVAGVAGAPVNCPPQIKTTPVASITGNYDVLGVKPGMTYDEAVNVLRCADNKLAATVKNENMWRINYAGIETRQGFTVEVPRTPEEEEARRQAIYDSIRGAMNTPDPDAVQPGKVRYTASTVGVPGDERVITFTSEQAFAVDSLPPIESLKASLIEKYGPPVRDDKGSGYRAKTYLAWGYDASGAATNTCGGYVNSFNFTDRCGVQIAAEIEPDAENFELATKLSVSTAVSNWGYTQIEKAEADLAALAAQRRAEGVEKAKENAEAPKL